MFLCLDGKTYLHMACSITGVNALRLLNLRESWRKKKLAEGKWIAFIVIWCHDCERKKRRKRWRNKRRGHSASEQKEKSQWVRLRTMQSWRIVCVKASKREEKNIESKRKLWEIHSEWKEKRVFFLCSSCISKCCNLYLI